MAGIAAPPSHYAVTYYAPGTQGATWANWAGNGITITASSTTTNYSNLVWNTWAGTGSGITITGSNLVVRDNVWTGWQQDPWRGPIRQIETPEERQAREDAAQVRREEQSRRRLAAQRQLAHAQERALDLLAMILNPEETAYRVGHDGDILVRGSDGGRFVILTGGGVHGNIREVDEHGCILGSMCVAPRMYDTDAGAALPTADGWVGQYLGLKFNEAEYRALANWSYRSACKHPDVPILGQVAA